MESINSGIKRPKLGKVARHNTEVKKITSALGNIKLNAKKSAASRHSSDKRV